MVRTMASKKKKTGSGGGSGAKKPIEFMVEGLDQMYEECQAADFNQVMKNVAKAYKVMPGELSNGTYTMQLGNEYGEWEDLTSFNQLKEACNEDDYGGPSIRIKELAEEGDDDDMDEYDDDLSDDDEDYQWDKNERMGGGNEEMKEVMNDLVEALKADGWRLVESKELPSLDEFKLIRKENGGEEMSARALVVKYANGLPDLQDQLLMEIGSLDHIVQCLQFGFLWESDEKQQDESE